MLKFCSWKHGARFTMIFTNLNDNLLLAWLKSIYEEACRQQQDNAAEETGTMF